MSNSKLLDLIRTSKNCVAFTGAGISTLAGIRDFRGKNGLYKQPNTEKMFDIDVFHSDPSVYYSMASEFIYGLDEKQPAVVHRVLAKLEQVGTLRAVITQNIDLLHQKAGSKTVYEIHGSPSIHRCTSCSHSVSFEDVMPVAREGKVPHCAKCGGVLKPEITFFGESLPYDALMNAQKAAQECDLMLVLGSSLTVYPAAAIPEITLRSGGEIVIVNDQATHLDSMAQLLFSDLGETFDYLEQHLS